MNSPKYNEKYVEKSNIKLSKKNLNGLEYRFSLEITLKGRENNNDFVSIIMMNPSKANKKTSDRSVNKVIKYIYTNKDTLFSTIGKIYIFNLYPVYETYSKEFTNLYNNYTEQQLLLNNDAQIISIVKKSKFIIAGWGLANKLKKDYQERYKARCCDLYDKVYNVNNNIFCVGTLTKKRYPRHLGRNRNLFNSKLYRLYKDSDNEFYI
ncbi:DUF1643 domain-containing protein [Clostridium perfringens]|uniref:DUF1643 domain-containing protein n=1 Tax=Clostridium perfringens TaxID=1502 RepID=UPI002447635B|nr:DUF1643 domain-containing protein [Clostridium perfringens]MDH2339172.1 DUF1643 domain-containing protein [Clostridium perfringens]MDM0696843.1 DUF1643 domain-containing protein [Clostridium perfringens]MDN4736456.1 DUF1643 domain-containing protein [Clostridium perfringens]MDN4739919.1 DUF1643 domain-containing protein [Clostridium perfringens]HDI3013945.1 DUF1643 domain-containing protein [Clostridium perfringens]